MPGTVYVLNTSYFLFNKNIIYTSCSKKKHLDILSLQLGDITWNHLTTDYEK